MERTPRRLAVLVPATATLLVAAACGGETDDTEAAADYPTEDITIVVPFAAGGPTDTVTRLIAEPMSEELGVSIIVRNVEGAGGTVAAGEVAGADADGYEVLIHHIGMSTAPALYPDLAYDPLTDFRTVGLVTDVPMTVVARGDLEPDTLDELTDYLSANTDEVTLANAGPGAASQLCGLLLENALGIDLTEVPYDGTGPALTDLVGGQVDVMCDQSTNTVGQIRAGDIKGYAVTTPERVDALPDLPTTAEAGLEGVEVTVWHGLYVPAGTPDEVVQRLTEALAVALEDENVVDQMAELGTAPVAPDQVTPEAHAARLEEQIELWTPIITDAGVSVG
jgi:tripartite-type tricarboxylate transporter receptor subunit TctC